MENTHYIAQIYNIREECIKNAHPLPDITLIPHDGSTEILIAAKIGSFIRFRQGRLYTIFDSVCIITPDIEELTPLWRRAYK